MSFHRNKAVRAYGHGIDAALDQEFRERRVIARCLAAQANLDAGLVGFGDYTLYHPFHRRVLPLAFLAPDIVEAILEGRQPVELTAARLKRIRLAHAWASQRQILGFTA